MDENYVAGLAVLKRSFMGRTETPEIVQIIAESFGAGQFTLLDVGTGDGDSLRKILNSLQQRGLMITATALDRYTPETDHLANLQHVIRVRADFNDWVSAGRFDIVIARQSLYHFDALRPTLGKLLSHVAPRGMLLVVLWTAGCALNVLSTKLFGNEEASRLTAEHVFSVLESDFGHDPHIFVFRGPTYLSTLIENPVDLVGVLQVLSRSNEASPFASEVIASARTLISSLGPVVERENGIVWVRT
jgi:SAM-dependent methyltransferase